MGANGSKKVMSSLPCPEEPGTADLLPPEVRLRIRDEVRLFIERWGADDKFVIRELTALLKPRECGHIGYSIDPGFQDPHPGGCLRCPRPDTQRRRPRGLSIEDREANLLWVSQVRSVRAQMQQGVIPFDPSLNGLVNAELNAELDRTERMRRGIVSDSDMRRREEMLCKGICWQCEEDLSAGWNGEYPALCVGCAREAWWVRNMYRRGKAATTSHSTTPFRGSEFDKLRADTSNVFYRKHQRLSTEQLIEQQVKEMKPLDKNMLDFNSKVDEHKREWANDNPKAIEETKQINYEPIAERRRQGGTF